MTIAVHNFAGSGNKAIAIDRVAEDADCAPTTARCRTQHYRIGAIPISLTSDHRTLLQQYDRLYGRWSVSSPPVNAVEVSARKQPRRGWHRRRFDVRIGDRVQFEPARRREVFPYVEWAINWDIPRMLPQYLQFHASSLVRSGKGVIFPANSGSGKSTLTAGLVSRGWHYLCDEFALVDIHDGTLHPYPRAICIKKPSFCVMASLGITLADHCFHIKGGKGQVGYIDPFSIPAATIGEPCPIRFVVFPQYVAGATPALTPISRAEAAFALHQVCFNLLDCQAVGLDVIAGFVRQASCFRLTTGDIHQTCDLLESHLP